MIGNPIPFLKKLELLFLLLIGARTRLKASSEIEQEPENEFSANKQTAVGAGAGLRWRASRPNLGKHLPSQGKPSGASAVSLLTAKEMTCFPFPVRLR